MNDEELRIKIAKARGYWVEGEPQTLHTFMYWVMTPDGRAVTTGAHTEALAWDLARANGLQNWPGSIAAAYELEGEIPENQQKSYVHLLIVGMGAEIGRAPTDFEIIHATPAQRCRAWLQWKEALG